MVFFICNNCGESVKKPAVEKHYNMKCRNQQKNVTCMDCQKDFIAEDYVAHTKCISEAEKYSGKGYVPKPSQNKGLKKQETWTEIVRSILENYDYKLQPQTRNIFQRLQNYENVPRKKQKFQNFVANCLRIPPKQAEPVWEVLEKELEKMKQAKQQEMKTNKKSTNSNEIQNAAPAEGKQNGIKHKTKEDSLEQLDKTETFQFRAALQKMVSKYEDGIAVNKLKEKFRKKYKTKRGIEEWNEEQSAKYEKKFAKALKKCTTIQVVDDLVKPTT